MSLLESPPPASRLGLPVLGIIGLLLIWNPLTLALVAATAWPRLARYGLPAWALLGVRMSIAALGLVAARWVLERDPRGARAAAASFLANAGMAVILGLTPFFPSNYVPGTKWPSVAFTVTMNVGLAWYATRRSKDP